MRAGRATLVPVAHGHAHTIEDLDAGPPRKRLSAILAVIVTIITLLALAAMVALWPAADDVPSDRNPLAGPGVTTVDAVVSSVEEFDCGSGGIGPDQLPTVDGNCAQVVAQTDEGPAEFTLDSARTQAGISEGDQIELIRFQPEGQSEISYEFLDFERSTPLLLLTLVFALLAVVVARWRGLFALLGVGITLLALMRFVLPAILAGEPPLLVAVVGSTLIMIVLLYLAHGVSIRTTSALFGTFFGIAFTAAVGAWATDWAHLTGIAGEDDRTLVATVPELNMGAVVAATMVIAGLGVLNDVTVTQASAVWEMRALRPTARAGELFASAMRIGRDHIASSVYTLVFAYAGASMTILLLISAYQRDLGQMATTEEIGQEIVRTLVGMIGFVLAVPMTTLCAVALAPPAQDEEPQTGGQHRKRFVPS